MYMYFGRTLPPAAAPIPLAEVFPAFFSICNREKKEQQFKGELQEEFNQQHCFLVSSGKAALTLILRALKELHPGRTDVIVPAYTCYSVAAAVNRAGLRMVLCDVELDTLDLDKKQLGDILHCNKGSILCVVVTHLFGLPADFNSINELIGGVVPIVEDAAQAMGEEYDGQKLGTLGDVGFFSLGRGKALSTMSGGIILTNDEAIGQLLRTFMAELTYPSFIQWLELNVKALLTSTLQHPFLFWIPKSVPFLRLGETIFETDFVIQRFGPAQVALARKWQQRLEKHQRVRKRNVSFWRSELSKNTVKRAVYKENMGLIRYPLLMENSDDRKHLWRLSEQAGAGLMPSYPTAINEIQELTGELDNQAMPNAQKLAATLITLPVHEYVTNKDKRKILDLFEQAENGPELLF